MSKVDINDCANTAIKAIDDKSAELRSISIKVHCRYNINSLYFTRQSVLKNNLLIILYK